MLTSIAKPYLAVQEARKLILAFTEAHAKELKEKLQNNPEIWKDICQFDQYVLRNKWFPYNPKPRQALFIWDKTKELLYGGAARGGKSVGLLMCALMFVDVPGFSALIVTKTLIQSKLSGGIIQLSKDWELAQKGAVYNASDFCWTFPSGAKLQFGYLNNADDTMRYKSTSWSLICFDELTNFESEDTYTYLFSRLSQGTNSDIPQKMRAASNPDGPGHDWVKNRFHCGKDDKTKDPTRLFMPAKLWENFGHNREEYAKNLAKLPEITRKQLEYGDWDITPDGQMFKMVWFKKGPADGTLPKGVVIKKAARYWDLAGSAVKPGKDPDYSVGAKIGYGSDGNYYILDIVRFRETPGAVRAMARMTAEGDGLQVWNWMEQEGGQSGLEQAQSYAGSVFKGFKFKAYRTTGSKENRAELFSSAAENGLICILVAQWNIDLLNEFSMFPLGAHDDIVDACCGAYNMLQEHKSNKAYTIRYA